MPKLTAVNVQPGGYCHLCEKRLSSKLVELRVNVGSFALEDYWEPQEIETELALCECCLRLLHDKTME